MTTSKQERLLAEVDDTIAWLETALTHERDLRKFYATAQPTIRFHWRKNETRDAIAAVLKERGPMRMQDIMAAIRKSRGAVNGCLQANKDKFARLGHGVWGLIGRS